MREKPEHVSAQAFVEEARRWVGRPFRHQGRSEWGVDCIGLIICARDACAPWPRGMGTARDYRRNPQNRLLEQLPEHCEPLARPEVGAIALICWPKQKIPSHVGIITPDTIIHSYQAAGRVVETGYRGTWLRWTHSLWRLPGVEP